MSNHQRQQKIPIGAHLLGIQGQQVSPEQAEWQKAQGLRLALAGQYSLNLLSKAEILGLKEGEGPIMETDIADAAVTLADAMLRRLSEGPFALSINWDEKENQGDERSS